MNKMINRAIRCLLLPALIATAMISTSAAREKENALDAK